jgi:hypothetical protein
LTVKTSRRLVLGTCLWIALCKTAHYGISRVR